MSLGNPRIPASFNYNHYCNITTLNVVHICKKNGGKNVHTSEKLDSYSIKSCQKSIPQVKQVLTIVYVICYNNSDISERSKSNRFHATLIDIVIHTSLNL